MLDKLEKAQWILSSLVVLVFLGFFFFPGLPAPVPDVLPPQVAVSAQEFEKALTPSQLNQYRKRIAKASSAAKKLSRNYAAVRKEYKIVPREVYEVARDLRQAAAQAKLARGYLDKKRRTVRLTGFQDGSYLPSLGFREGDTIELISGEPLPVTREEAERLYEEKLRELEAGGALVVTVNRGGRRFNMIFRLGDLQALRH